MTDLYIIGTGGAAKEIIQLVEQINKQSATFSISGFITLEAADTRIVLLGVEYPLYSETDFLNNIDQVSVVISNGFPEQREKIFTKFSKYNFPNLIHPLVDIHKSVSIGKGNIFKNGTIITTDITIGSNNYFNRGTQIGHDNIIGSNNVFNPGAILSGSVNLGSSILVGTNATILQNLSVNDSAQVGAGAVVTKAVGAGCVVVGVPAKKV